MYNGHSCAKLRFHRWQLDCCFTEGPTCAGLPGLAESGAASWFLIQVLPRWCAAGGVVAPYCHYSWASQRSEGHLGHQALPGYFRRPCLCLPVAGPYGR